MSGEIPEDLQNLAANGGIYAIWMLFQHYGIDLDIGDLVELCQHTPEDGSFGIALAVALQQLGLDVVFSTQDDPAPHPTELAFYRLAAQRQLPIVDVLSYEALQAYVEQGRFVIVYYDRLDGVANHSLVYSMDDQEICFFDSFDAMSKDVFIQQRQQEGICQQAIVIDDRNFVMREA